MWQLNQKIVKDVKVVLDDIGGVLPPNQDSYGSPAAQVDRYVVKN